LYNRQSRGWAAISIFMPYKLAQLVVTPEHKSEVLSRIFIGQPSMEEEQILGKLFVLVEIKNQKTDIMLANFIIDRINLFYYQNEQVPLLARMATITVNDIFENALGKLNQEIVTFTQTEKLTFNPQAFNITIGIIFKNKLYFANIGHNKTLLIYKSKTKNNRQINDHNLINITASTADPTQEIVLDNKLFTSTVSGSIPPEGYAVFANESLYEFLSEKQLIKIITTLPPNGAAEQIKNILEQTNVYMPFVGLIIKNQQLAKPLEDWRVPVLDPRVKAEPSPVHHALEPSRRREQAFRQERDLNKESIKALNRTAAKTAHILRPPGFVNLAKIKKVLSQFKLPQFNRQQNKLIVNRANLGWLKREGAVSLKKIWSGLVKLGAIAFRLAVQAGKILGKLIKREERQEIKNQVSDLKKRFSRRHLIILGLVGLCLVAFIFSLYYSGVQRDKRAKETAWSQAQTQFGQVEKQIAADLLYGDKNKAALSLGAMTDSLNQLKANAGSQHQSELTAITSRYQALSDKLSGLIRLATLDKVWSLPDGQTADNLGFANGKLYVASQTGQNVTQVDATGQNSQVIISNEPGIKLLNVDRDGNIFFLGQNKLISLDKTGKITSRPINGLTNEPVAASVYNNRLYLFDQASEQIYRYQLTATLANPTAWLAAPFTGKAQDLAVDTSIFILADNQIFKYDAGNGSPIALDSVIPVISQASKLVTPAGSDILAIIDGPTKRLIIFSRSGKLLSQYTSETWSDLKDVSLEPGGKTAYILNGQDVYKINLAAAK
jgi:hypothetical protein